MRSLAIGTLAILCASCAPTESKLVAACEEVLKQRLRSPSGYTRIKLTEGAQAQTSILFIEYDAPNAFGTAVRGLAKCEYDVPSGGGTEVSISNVRIDGKTRSQWMIDSAQGRR